MKENMTKMTTSNTENVSNIEFLKELFKRIWLPLSIIMVSLILFFSFLPMKNNLEKRFITPYTNSVTKQSDDLYIVATYYSSDETSIKFLQTLNEVEKKYDIPYYLINISTYPDIVNSWELTYLPTYFVFERTLTGKDATLVYKSYGNKQASALNKEIINVRKYGMPISNIGGTLTIKDENDKDYLEATLVTIKPNEETPNNYSIEFYVKNLTDKEIKVNYSNFVVTSNLWDATKDKMTATNNTSSKTVTLASGKAENIIIEYSGEFAYNQLDITYKQDEEANNKYKWTYKLWSSEESSN